MKKNIHTLSKSSYVEGSNCIKSLWLSKIMPELKEATTEADLLKKDEGTAIGEIARNYPIFKGGNLVKSLSNKKSIAKTKELLETKNIIYEAAFGFTNELFHVVRIDILVQHEDKSVSIIEVKSSSSVKKEHLTDVAYQKYVVEQSGYRVKDCLVMYLNNKYEYDGQTLDLEKYFVLEDVNDEIINEYIKIHEMANFMFLVLQNETEPNFPLGSYCDSPRPCPFKGHCWSNVDDNHIEHLQRLNYKKREELLNLNITKIQDIPQDFPLTETQQIQYNCAVEDLVHFEYNPINDFVASLNYPLYFLDFESLVKGLPYYKGMKPNQFITYQASIHTLNESHKQSHSEFLHTKPTNPHLLMLEYLKAELGDTGDIIVFNKSFELGRLSDMAKEFPEYEEYILSIKKRVVDLAYPFQKFFFYSHAMKGSTSIKTILPLLVPSLSYKKLDISNGLESQVQYSKLIFNEKLTKKEKKKIIKDLKKYNTLDTQAMVFIYKKVLEILSIYKKSHKTV